MLVILIAAALAVSAGACGSGSDNQEESADESADLSAEMSDASGSAENSETEEAVPEGDGEVSTDKIAFDFDEPEDEAVDETEIQEAAESEDMPNIADAVDGAMTTEYEPVPFGDWAKVQLYATQDSTYHTVYVRVVRVTTQSGDSSYVESAIEVNNVYGGDEGQYDPADQDIAEDCELVVLDYEVYVPTDFPAANYGMPEPKVYFSLRNVGGGGFPSWDGTAYISMGTTTELSVRAAEETYYPGNTYGERCIYLMVKDYTGYVASYSSYPEGTTSEETSSENMYTVYHSVE